jgi:hypothetical protein
MMNNKERIREIFIKYGYIDMDYINDDEDGDNESLNNLLKYAEKHFLDIKFHKGIYSDVAIIKGCYSDVREILHEFWNPVSDENNWEEIDFYMESFTII